MKTIKLGLVGCGTVGTGLVEILKKHTKDFENKLGLSLELAKVTSRTKERIIDAGVPEEKICSNYKDIINDPEIDIVVELIGGTTAAYDVCMDALNAGKHVVTANKALVSTKGKELFHAAEANQTEIAFEASVGGGIPIIEPLKHSLTGNAIEKVIGIVNGTTNYMLTKMSKEACDYADVLKQAQDLGYAEADPTADVEGHDSAAKIAILASIAFNSRVTFDDVYCQGITQLIPIDFINAKQLGYDIKLLAIAQKTDDKIDVRVHPAMISLEHQMARVDGVYNAIFITGDSVGDCMFFGEGAGAGAAASAVMGDIIEVSRHIAYELPAVVGCTCTEKLEISDIKDLETCYYIRVGVIDEIGTLTNVSSIFSKNNVSIKSILQNESTSDEYCNVVIITHKTKEANLMAALAELEQSDSVKKIGTYIRIEN